LLPDSVTFNIESVVLPFRILDISYGAFRNTFVRQRLLTLARSRDFDAGRHVTAVPRRYRNVQR